MIRSSLHRLTVVVGGYGSGKTEVAINLSLRKRKSVSAEYQVQLVDLDIVNPYFRSRDQLEPLSARGVTVVAPQVTLRHADLPALPAAVGSAILRRDNSVVIDVGGDPAGATALGRYSRDINSEPHDVLMVVNPFRPHTRTANDVIGLMKMIEQKSRLKVTGLINNANLMDETTLENLVAGQMLLDQINAVTGVETIFVACQAKLAPQIQGLWPVDVLALDLVMRPPWLES